MDPYIIPARLKQEAWIATKEIGTNVWSKSGQSNLAQEEDSNLGEMIYLLRGVVSK